jgi:hypothetical protein
VARVGEDAAERRRIADETLDAAAAWERDRVQAEEMIGEARAEVEAAAAEAAARPCGLCLPRHTYRNKPSNLECSAKL